MKNQINVVVGRRMKETRKALHITQDELATLTGYTRTSITNIEAGIQPLSVVTLYKFAAALGVDAHHLLPTSDDIQIETSDDIQELRKVQKQIERLQDKAQKIKTDLKAKKISANGKE